MLTVKICIVRAGAKVPSRASEGSAGFDLFAAEEAVIPPTQTAHDGGVDVGRCLIPIGIAVELPAGTVGRIASRSGLSVKFNVEVGAGWIDSDYRGELMIELKNFSSSAYKVQPGDRIAQLVILQLSPVDIRLADELGHSERGISGFGSSGK